MRRRSRSLALWLALWATLLAALAPTVSHALGRQAAAPWMEVCSSQGPRWVADGTEPAPSPPALLKQLLDHCPCCHLQCDAGGLPPATHASLPQSDAAFALPAAFLTAGHTLHAWRSAQARAPPPRA